MTQVRVGVLSFEQLHDARVGPHEMSARLRQFGADLKARLEEANIAGDLMTLENQRTVEFWLDIPLGIEPPPPLIESFRR